MSSHTINVKQLVQNAQSQEDWAYAISLLEDELQIPNRNKLGEDVSLWNSLGYNHFMAGNIIDAELILGKALMKWRDNLDLLNNLAQIYIQEQKFSMATELVNRALAIDPDNVQTLLLLGNCSIELGEIEVALMAFRRIETIAPDTEGVQAIITEIEMMEKGKIQNSPIFIGGAGRSGTTLVRVILDSHPDIACGPELKVLPSIAKMSYDFQTTMFPTLQSYLLTHEDIRYIFKQMITELLEKYHNHSGKRRIAEKTPHNVIYFQQLHQLFPESPLIHIIRDGRDVVCSLLKMNWIDPKTQRPLDYTRDVRKAIEYWVYLVKQGRTILQNASAVSKYIELRYENIVSQPEPTLRKLFDFIGENWYPSVLDFYKQDRNLANESSASQVVKPLNTKSLGRWKRELKPREKKIVKEVAGDLLIELGYADDKNW